MLVRVENEQVVTDSRKVAEVFGKEHANAKIHGAGAV